MCIFFFLKNFIVEMWDVWRGEPERNLCDTGGNRCSPSWQGNH
jgi:hypothetical protein